MEHVNNHEDVILDTSNNSNRSLGRLIRHIWDVLTCRTGDRISRGEYILASGYLGVIMAALMTVFMWIYRALVTKGVDASVINVFWWIFGLVYLGSVIWSLSLGVRRLKDLNMSPWRIIVPILPILAIFIPRILRSRDVSQNTMGIFGILMLILGIGSLILAIKMLFYRGTKGSNQYGADPLITQPTSNANYRGAFALIVLANIIVSLTTGSNQSLERAMLRGFGMDPDQLSNPSYREGLSGTDYNRDMNIDPTTDVQPTDDVVVPAQEVPPTAPLQPTDIVPEGDVAQPTDDTIAPTTDLIDGDVENTDPLQ